MGDTQLIDLDRDHLSDRVYFPLHGRRSLAKYYYDDADAILSSVDRS